MKIWLNKLKPGDKFWSSYEHNICQFEILGYVENSIFRMRRFNCKIIEEKFESLEIEFFVNQYVYDNKEEALEKEIKLLKLELSLEKEKVKESNKKIFTLQNNLDKLIVEYGQEII